MVDLNQIGDRIRASIEVKEKLLEDENALTAISQAAHSMVQALAHDGKVLLCGNGGSAADAQHIAAELTGRFYTDRPPLFAEALHVNSSYMTAVANDYSYDEVYSRLIKAKGRKNDVLVAISTSGNSSNIIKAVEQANEQGLVTVGLTGESGGKLDGLCTFMIKVPSSDTPRIQEAHILIGHIICEMVENLIFKEN